MIDKSLNKLNCVDFISCSTMFIKLYLINAFKIAVFTKLRHLELGAKMHKYGARAMMLKPSFKIYSLLYTAAAVPARYILRRLKNLNLLDQALPESRPFLKNLQKCLLLSHF